jgi:hypothetical protein
VPAFKVNKANETIAASVLRRISASCASSMTLPPASTPRGDHHPTLRADCRQTCSDPNCLTGKHSPQLVKNPDIVMESLHSSTPKKANKQRKLVLTLDWFNDLKS